MKEVTLLQSDLRPNMEVLRSSLGAGPSLENRILTHASSFVLQAPSWATLTSSCPALCPSSLSSTTSSSPLLSTSSSLLSSSLLSTENTQLKSSPLSVSTLCSSQPLNAPVQSTAPPAAEKASGLSGEHGELDIDEDESYSTDELRSHSDDVSEISDHEQQTEIDGETRDEMPVLDLRMTDDEEEQKLDVDEGFEEFDPGSDRDAELLKEKKYKLLNLVCCSLVNKTSSPGQLDWDSDTTVWSKIKLLGTAITLSDPEFLLKVAVYTRQELNIRVTANFLLALAAHLPESKPHLRRYFCSAIQLPSDWLEVTRIYSTCFSKSLPSGLKKGLVDKFKQFNEYQLAKYNTRKHCGKHKKKRTAKEVSDQQWDEWARLVGADTYKLQRHLKMDERAAVDKKQSEFNMKKLIKRLHIKEPAELVMGILGKKYPADARAFWRSGLSGVWQSERANQRMRLKRLETWETQLSQEGNNATTWEKLLDNNSLPFMAMLRNLRNMVMAGISHKHHDQILNRLCSKSAVIKSRQFPFRFLSAYKVILELDSSSVSGSAKLKTSSKEILRGILKTIPKSGKYKRLDWSTASRQRLRNALRVPFVRRFYYTKLRALQKARQRRISPELLQRYREALDKAVQISCRHNIPPLPGHTLIIVLDSFCSKKLKRADFSLPPECSDGNTEETNLSPTSQEAGLLLAMMIRFCSEHTQFLLGDDRAVREVQIEEGGLLENVRKVNKLVEEFSDSTEKIPHSEFFSKLLEDKIKVDNIICLSDYSVDWWMMLAVKRFQKLSVTQPLVVNILLTASSHFEDSNDPNTVTLCGFSEQILRFVSERGSSRLLDHVEQIDKLHKIPPPADSSAKHERTVDVVPLPEVPKLRWRGVRVFISSTFRDMHGERDVLIRSVFPELRRRAAALCLHLQEVDLRWGVTEDESERATEICLQEVCRSQVLLGILGQRYGVVPPRPSLPDLPHYSWLKSAPDGLSITEMEIRQFQAVFPDSPQSRAFFYFRSPQLLNSVPEAWRRDFIAESEETADKVGALKERIKNDGFKVTENYPCEWGGVVDGKAYVSTLDVFAKAVMEDLWTAIEKLFVEESDAADLTADIKEQEVHQDAQRRQFYGRTKLLSKAKDKIKECQQKGGVLLVEGGTGVGKTAFMAALAHTLQTPEKMKNAPMCDVISYTTAASQSAAGVEPLLRCLDQWLRKRKQKEEALTSDTPYRDLLSEFLAHLKEVKKGRALALLVDGADLVHDAKGQRISEWIPQYVPKGVCLVLSVTTNSDLCNIVSKTKSCVSFPLGPLLLPDRREIVQKELSVYGKKLSDSAFNNQLQTLLMKKGSVSPLYLRLACDELRNYATFEKMKETLQLLPASLCELVQFGLIRLQTQYRGTGLNWTLAALTVSSTGLKDRDLHFLLNLCTDLSSSHTTLNWQEVMKLARNPKTRVPMATFSQLARSLQSLIGSSLRAEPEQSLVLSNPDVKSAFERLYLSDPDDRSRAHLILAAHLWMRSDPHGRDTFLHCDPESLALLPAHLTKSGQCEATRFLLCSYNFLYANVRQGLLRSLIESYRVYEESDEAHKPHCPEASGLSDELVACRSFLKRHAPLLSHWPALFVQQALNEPDDSAAHAWAKRAAEEGNIQPVRWMNRSTEPRQEAGELVSTFQWTPSCVSLSPAGVLVAVGTAQGSLHLYHTHTNQEVMSLLSNCDGISGCVFLDERVLWTTSYDGQVEAWDVGSGCRTAQLTAHSNRITGCDVSKDRKHLATVSLDFTLKVWSSHKGTQEASLKNPSPLNCVTFDPEGRLVAVGCWDGVVRVWDWIKQENCMTLSGHQCAVRCVSFSPSSLCLLSSGSLDGEMRLWSVPGSSCLWRSRAHRGSTEALRFLSNGESLLSAGHDGMVQMWSGGLGCSVSVLGAEKKLLKSCESRHTVIAEDPALCVAVNGRYAAVGYHGNGIKLFNIQSGVCVWSTEDLRVSMLCVIWLQASAGLLLSGGVDQRLRLWRKRRDDSVELAGVFGVQKGGILALSQNYTHVASASDDFTIALWLKKDLISDRWTEPTAVCILRGHSGGVTCLAFSPKGDELLSGGKDKALMMWKINSSPPCLSRSFLHCHGDWITGCAWTPSALLSCSNDCRLRLWDVQTGSCIVEISTASSVGTLCCWEGYVMFGSSDGLLTVWKTDLGVITEIQAHSTRLHHCTIASQPGPGMKPENLLVATASDDGSVKVWNPLQVQHRSTLIGHSASVHALASCSGPNFLTVSDDRSLRVWSVNTDMPPRQLESVSALCFLELQDVLVCAFSSGRLEMWQQLKLLYSNQLSDACITAVSGLPDQQLALGCSDASVSVWKLERDSQQCITGLSKVSSSRLSSSVSFLHYSTTLLGVCVDSTITHIFPTTAGEQPKTEDWFNQVRVLGIQEKGENGTWLLGDEDDTLKLAYLHTHPTHTHPTHTPQGGTPKSVKRPLRICTNVSLEAGWVYTEEEEEDEEEEEEEDHLSEYMGEEPEKETDGEAGTEEEEEMEMEMEEEVETESRKDSLTAAALHDELIVCGDSKGHMWFNETPTLSSWTPRKPAHGDRISALRLTQSLIISASYDRTVKLWDRNTKKQLGVFVCDAPVEVLQVNPNNPSQMVCGDALGQIYFLSWRG